MHTAKDHSRNVITDIKKSDIEESHNDTITAQYGDK